MRDARWRNYGIMMDVADVGASGNAYFRLLAKQTCIVTHHPSPIIHHPSSIVVYIRRPSCREI
jgi:hypothetical protein